MINHPRPSNAENGTASIEQAEPTSTAYDFAFVSISGEPLPLSQFAGNVLLLVNTASFCGFTKQYADLQTLWQRYRDRGLVVLGVPSNDFGRQEPGKRTEIKAFCTDNYSIDFTLTDKTAVTGDDAHPIYRWARLELGGLAAPKWNFHKYLVGRDGRLITWFSSPTSPASKKIVRAVESALCEAI